LSADYAGLPIGVHRFRHDCKPDSTTKPLKVTVSVSGLVWYCHRCHNTGPLIDADQSSRRRPIITAPAATHTTLSDYGRNLWRECRALDGDALEYLRARRCVIPPDDSHLRWHPKLKHPSGYVGTALVGLVTDTLTCEPMSLHRTWILPSGKKANVDPPRLLLKDHKKNGGVIRLWPDEAVTSSLSIAEGIETALCAAHGATPIWSCIDAGNMEKFPVLADLKSLIIFADHDEVGLHAANACAVRWAHFAEVTIVRPETPGTDMADAVATA
jgi:putative DNA primase/helicase